MLAFTWRGTQNLRFDPAELNLASRCSDHFADSDNNASRSRRPNTLLCDALGELHMRLPKLAWTGGPTLGLLILSVLIGQDKPGGQSDPATVKQIKAERGLKASPLTMARLRA